MRAGTRIGLAWHALTDLAVAWAYTELTKKKSEGQGTVVHFSGCVDGECAGDLCIGGVPCGILSHALWGICRQEGFNLTFLDYLKAARTISKYNNTYWKQVPQLSFNREFDLHHLSHSSLTPHSLLGAGTSTMRYFQ